MFKNKNLLIVLVVLLIIPATLFILEKAKITNFYERTPTAQPSDNKPIINLEPPTEEESKAGDDIKEEIVEEESTQIITPEGEKTKANVVIVDATQYVDEIEVRAFISNVVKNGTCTYVFTNGSDSVEKSMPANADASSTPCMTLTVPRSEFSRGGTWSLVVSYNTDTAEGSTETTVEVK